MTMEEDPQEIGVAHMEVEVGVEVAAEVEVVERGEIETAIIRNITQNTKTTVTKMKAIEKRRDRRAGILSK